MVQRTILPNGLRVAFYKKPGFMRRAASLAVRYGAVDMDFEGFSTPPGVAHFLEHKMFDMPDGTNVMQKFGSLGASPNAGTAAQATVYYFETTENFAENLKLLLDYVYTPYYTPESVDKEQSIIAQEIAMGEDDPHRKIYKLTMSALYRNHPVRIPGIGTAESIREITADTLYNCHAGFYKPNNMALIVSGDEDFDEILKIAREHSPESGGVIARRTPVSEPENVHQKFISAVMDVPVPLFSVGVKFPPLRINALEADVLATVAGDYLLGESSLVYNDLYDRGLIDRSFSAGGYPIRELLHFYAAGQSREPEAVRDAVISAAETAVREGIDLERLNRVKKAVKGSVIRLFDDPTALSTQQSWYEVEQCDLADYADTVDKLSPESLINFYKQFNSDKISLAVISGGTEK